MAINFEDDAKSMPTAQSDLTEVANLATLAKEQKAVIDAMEKKLKELAAGYRRTIEVLIPDAMEQVGFRSIKLEDGRSITVKDDIKASIPVANRPEAMRWLEEHNHGGLIKSEITIPCPRGVDTDPITNALDAMAVPFEKAQSVHSSTLASFLREQLAEGANLPLDLFGAYQFRTAVIKEK